MNRIHLNNCGISGENFATILDGLLKMKDLKSIYYKNNELNSVSIQKMHRIFTRKIPYNLSKLHIIDCKMLPA